MRREHLRPPGPSGCSLGPPGIAAGRRSGAARRRGDPPPAGGGRRRHPARPRAHPAQRRRDDRRDAGLPGQADHRRRVPPLHAARRHHVHLHPAVEPAGPGARGRRRHGGCRTSPGPGRSSPTSSTTWWASAEAQGPEVHLSSSWDRASSETPGPSAGGPGPRSGSCRPPSSCPLEIPLDIAARILTLAVRLLANMFADHTGDRRSGWPSCPSACRPSSWAWDCIISFLQAFIFSLLTMIYIGLGARRAPLRGLRALASTST